MQESLVKIILFFSALFSLAVGVLLLVFPSALIQYTGITGTDIGWFRGLGGAVIAFQGFGLMAVAFRRRDTNPLLTIVALATSIQAGAVWYSLFAAEYGEMSRWAVIAFAILATVAAVFLWLSWIARRKSIGTLAPRKQKVGDQAAGQVADPAPAELLEQIDQESPRFKE